MWQSNRSRSTGWQSPAVPPLLSASHPGENTSEQPSGKCGICGTPLRCSATTSLTACSMRTALRLTDLRCFMVTLESRKKRRVADCQFAVDRETHVGPPANPLAVVQVRVAGVAVSRVRLVIAPARAQRACPAHAAVGLVRDVVLLEKRRLGAAIDSVADAANFVLVAAGEAMAERHVAVGCDPEQSEAGTARIGFADALVQFLEGLVDVGEAVMTIRDRRLEKFMGQVAELIEHAIVAVV